MTEEQLEATGWLETAGLQVIKKQGATTSCVASKQGSSIDFMVASAPVAALVTESVVDMTLPFRPHYAVKVEIKASLRSVWVQRVARPKPWPGQPDKEVAQLVANQPGTWEQSGENVDFKCIRSGLKWQARFFEDWPPEWRDGFRRLGFEAAAWAQRAENMLGDVLGKPPPQRKGMPLRQKLAARLSC